MATDRPTVPELVQAVREFLEAEVQPSLDGSVAFHTRVAVNVLKIVERELAEGPALAAAEKSRLVALLGHDGDLDVLAEELIEAIRAGRMDVQTPGLTEHLRSTVMAKLAIDNPRYQSYQRALQGGR
ncbi:MAG: hypothetical protein JJT88_16000 [Gammaproteobacteria bacterium]|nr:hypothetical protein [Gammaproteobacteria bacterium]